MRLTERDRDAIAAAVAEVETRTSGEVVCVLAERVSRYREIPLAWASAAALLLPPLMVALGLRPLSVSALLGEWVVGHASALDNAVVLAIAGYAVLQGVVFAAVGLLTGLAPVRRMLTPGAMKARRVREAARRHYLATGLPLSEQRTGVVIFASFDDRRVEIVADPLIDENGGEAAWAKAVAAVTSGMRRGQPGAGFVEAVRICGDALAQHFPDDDGANRMPDRPVEL